VQANAFWELRLPGGGTRQPGQASEAYLDQGWDKAAVQALVANIPQLARQVGCSLPFDSNQENPSSCCVVCRLGPKSQCQVAAQVSIQGVAGVLLGQPDQAWQAYHDRGWEQGSCAGTGCSLVSDDKSLCNFCCCRTQRLAHRSVVGSNVILICRSVGRV
jgi:hypothetical protein